jgi:hypothetical protein
MAPSYAWVRAAVVGLGVVGCSTDPHGLAWHPDATSGGGQAADAAAVRTDGTAPAAPDGGSRTMPDPGRGDGPQPADPGTVPPTSPPPPPIDAGAAPPPDAAAPADRPRPDTVAELGRGLVLYLPFDDGPGSLTPADRSGQKNETVLKEGGASWVEGRFGGALSLSGGLVMVRGEGLNAISDGLSISLWVRTAEPGGGVLLSRGAPGAAGFLYVLGLAGGHPRIQLNSSNGYHADLTASRVVAASAWVHLAVTYDLDRVRVFADGALIASEPYAHKIPPENAPVVIGAAQTASGAITDRFAGQLDELLLYARPLSTTEVAALAGGARPPLR